MRKRNVWALLPKRTAPRLSPPAPALPLADSLRAPETGQRWPRIDIHVRASVFRMKASLHVTWPCLDTKTHGPGGVVSLKETRARDAAGVCIPLSSSRVIPSCPFFSVPSTSCNFTRSVAAFKRASSISSFSTCTSSSLSRLSSESCRSVPLILSSSYPRIPARLPSPRRFCPARAPRHLLPRPSDSPLLTHTAALGMVFSIPSAVFLRPPLLRRPTPRLVRLATSSLLLWATPRRSNTSLLSWFSQSGAGTLRPLARPPRLPRDTALDCPDRIIPVSIGRESVGAPVDCLA